MTERLPLFPLGLVLFPGALLPLHIFEPRYRLLMRRCSERESLFGVVLAKSGDETGAATAPHTVGTAARIVAVNPLPDGRSFIVARGERRFAIERVFADLEPYLVGEVRWLDETDGPGADGLAANARDAYGRYLLGVATVIAEQGGEPSAEPPEEPSAAALSYRIAADLAIPDADRQRLLEAPTAAARLEAALHHLTRETDLVQDLLVRMHARGARPELH